VSVSPDEADQSQVRAELEFSHRLDAIGIDPRQSAKLTAILGIVHALLYLSTFTIIKWRVPRIGASDAEIVSFYSDPNERRLLIVVGLYLVPFTGIAFIWFIVVLRMWVSASTRRHDLLYGNIQLVSGILFTGLLFIAGASMSITAAVVEVSTGPIAPFDARQFPQYGSVLLLVFAMRMAAMFVLSTARIGRSAGLLPRWFVIASVLVAAGLLFSISLSTWLVVAFPAWQLTFCLILLSRARKMPRAQKPDRVAGPTPAAARL